MYMWSYRNEGAFHEKVTNDIVDDIVAATNPRFVRLTAKWYVRGGIYTNLVAEYRKKGWKPLPVIELPAHDSQNGLLGAPTSSASSPAASATPSSTTGSSGAPEDRCYETRDVRHGWDADRRVRP